MSTCRPPAQWDIVNVRINPNDRDEHPAIVISPPEACADRKKARLNVLYGTTRRPGFAIQEHEVQLNGADGLEHATLFSCGHIYTIDRARISARMGCVAHERRRQIGRKIIATFRLPM
jgi:mRNA-degrading endonuclease toxin of MazEF toxin-antitoxin module